MSGPSLRPIVAALGGDLWAGGQRACVPAPGHSAQDRSVSLLLSEGRVVIHAFGTSDWREVRAHLRDLKLIDDDGGMRESGLKGARCAPARPDPVRRLQAARDLWEEASPITPGSAARLHLIRRVGPTAAQDADGLRHHPAAPVAVYRAGGRRRPALIARISDTTGALTAVEIVYLSVNGLRAEGLSLPRKTVGLLPAGSAVRLSPGGETLLVGEGVMTVLSAAARYALPGWALLSAGNLSAWTPPKGVRQVLIAADRGPAGERSARTLAGRLSRLGVAARTALPPPGFGDWNEAETAARSLEEGSRRAPTRTGMGLDAGRKSHHDQDSESRPPAGGA